MSGRYHLLWLLVWTVYLGCSDASTQTGQPAHIRVGSYPNRLFAGVTHYLETTADPLSRTFRMEIRLANPEEKLRPGQIANAKVYIRHQDDGVFIPLDAVIGLGADPAVYVVKDYKAERRRIQTGAIIGQTVEEAGLRHLPGLYLVEIDREGRILTPVGPDETILASDRLVFAGVVATIGELQQILGLRPFPAEERPFRGHLTLARFRTRVLRPALPPVDLGAIRLERLVMLRSDLRPGGAVYSSIDRFPLGRRGVD